MTTLCAALYAAGALALTGCAPVPAPIATVSASPTADAPAFASEADALEAARTAYAAYLALSTTVGHEGGKSPERMASVLMGEALSAEVASLQNLAARGEHGVGEFEFDSLVLQSADLKSGRVIAYLCLDNSGADIVDELGTSTAPARVAERYPLEVSFALDTTQHRLLVQKSESWRGSNFC